MPTSRWTFRDDVANRCGEPRPHETYASAVFLACFIFCVCPTTSDANRTTSPNMTTDKIKVAVRVRPMNRRGKLLHASLGDVVNPFATYRAASCPIAEKKNLNVIAGSRRTRHRGDGS